MAQGLIRRIFLAFMVILQEINGFNCPPNYQLYGNGLKCFHFVYGQQNKKSWENARIFCEGEKGMLASITSGEETEFIRSQLTAITFDGKIWIGLKYTDPIGQYVWADGAVPVYTDWRPGEPGSSQNCISMRSDVDYTWVSTGCNSKQAFICQWPNRTEPMTSLPPTTQDPFAGEAVTTKSLPSTNAPTSLTVIDDTTSMISVISTNANPTSTATLAHDRPMSTTFTSQATTQRDITTENNSSESTPSAGLPNVSSSLTTIEDATAEDNSSIVTAENITIGAISNVGSTNFETTTSAPQDNVNSTNGVISYVGSTQIETIYPTPPNELNSTNGVISNVGSTNFETTTPAPPDEVNSANGVTHIGTKYPTNPNDVNSTNGVISNEVSYTNIGTPAPPDEVNITSGVITNVGSTHIGTNYPSPPKEVSSINVEFVTSGVFNTELNFPMASSTNPSSSRTETSDFGSMLSTQMTSPTLSPAFQSHLTSVTDETSLMTKAIDKERHQISNTLVLTNRKPKFSPTIHEAQGAAVIGILGIIVVCFIFGCVIISDLRALAEDFRDMLENICILEKEDDALTKYS